MGALGNAVTGMFQGAKQDANFRRELEDDPQVVLEREVGRKLTAEELEAAPAELKRNGLNVKAAKS